METSVKNTKKKKISLVNLILTVIFVLLLILVVMLFIGRAQNKPTFIFGKSCVWIMTNSMNPTIPEQTYILIEKIDASEVIYNDVIVFISDDPEIEGSMNTHRVVRVIGNNEEFVTKGDNPVTNVTEDEYTAKADKVLGRYVRNLPVLTKLMRFFLKPVGLAVALIFFVVISALFVIPDFVKAKKESDAKAKQEKLMYRQKLIDEEIEKLKAKNGLNDKSEKNQAETNSSNQASTTESPIDIPKQTEIENNNAAQLSEQEKKANEPTDVISESCEIVKESKSKP